MTHPKLLWYGPPTGLHSTLEASTGIQMQVLFAQALNDVRSKLFVDSLTCVCSTVRDEASARALIELVRRGPSHLTVGFYCPGLSADNFMSFMRLGADFCVCETVSPDRLEEIIDRAVAGKSAEVRSSADPCARLLIGDSEPMREVRHLIRVVSQRNSTVLVTGETGTGKDLAAQAIHQGSPRSSRNLVSVNCAALPESLLEAELFGHTKGAFTGAVSDRVGRFEEAHRASLFLDEIGEMPLDTQAKLLRVLQERELQRLGSSETIRIDIRLIAASNVDLAKATTQRRFRRDLLYRLRVVEVRMPSLRERIEDLPVLTDHFIDKICRRERLPAKRVEQDTLQFLAEHSWPGNVRELEHAIESAIIMSGYRATLIPRDFNLFSESVDEGAGEWDLPPGGVDLDQFVAKIEGTLLGQALRRSRGNKARAAEMLGIPRTTLISKVKSLQLVS